MERGHRGLAGGPAVFHAGAGLDSEHVSVPAPPLNMVADSVRGTMCILISVTVTRVQVSF